MGLLPFADLGCALRLPAPSGGAAWEVHTPTTGSADQREQLALTWSTAVADTPSVDMRVLKYLHRSWSGDRVYSVQFDDVIVNTADTARMADGFLATWCTSNPGAEVIRTPREYAVHGGRRILWGAARTATDETSNGVQLDVYAWTGLNATYVATAKSSGGAGQLGGLSRRAHDVMFTLKALRPPK